MSKMVVYKLGTSNGLSASEVIRVHAAHARNPEHGGRVLYTTGRGPAAENRDEVEELILMNSDGSTALRAKVADLGKTPMLAYRKPGYEQPSPWIEEDQSDKGFWYCLDVYSEEPVRRGEFEHHSGKGTKDLLDAIAGTVTFVYIELTD